MTDGAFSLSPPGSFPLSADPAFQDEVRRELELLLERVRNCAAAPSVAGVLLTGSFARWRGNHNPPSADQEPVVERRRVPGGSDGAASSQSGRFSGRCGRSSWTPTPIVANAARGIKVELRRNSDATDGSRCDPPFLPANCASTQSCCGAIPPRFRFRACRRAEKQYPDMMRFVC